MEKEDLELSEQVIKWIPGKMSGKYSLFDPKISLDSKKRKAFFIKHSKFAPSSRSDNFSLKLKLYKPNAESSSSTLQNIPKKFTFDPGNFQTRFNFLSRNKNQTQKQSSSLSPSKKLKFNHLNKAIFIVQERTSPESIKMTSTVSKKLLLPLLHKKKHTLTPIPGHNYIIPSVKTIEMNTDTINDRSWLQSRYDN